MIDIVSAEDGLDLGIYNTQTTKAANVLSIQLGSLEYLPEFGIDLAYFLSENVEFQNQSFLSYLVQVLASNSINVSSVIDVVHKLYHEYLFEISGQNNNTGLIAR